MQQQESVDIDEEYIPWKRAIRIICNEYSDDEYIPDFIIRGMRKLDKHLKVVELEKRRFYREYDEFARYVVLKKDVLYFKENYISRAEAFPMQSLYARIDSLEKVLKKNNVEIVRIAQKEHLTFYNRNGFISIINADVKKNSVLKYYETLSIDGLIYKEQLCQKYDISFDTWRRINEVVNLEEVSINKRGYYKEKDVAELLSSIRSGIDELYEKYYSATYLKNNYDLNRTTIRNNGRFKEIKVPAHYKPLLPYQDKLYFYDKESVDEYLKERAYYSVIAKNPYDAYKYKITCLEITFPEYLLQTEKFWGDFVRDNLRGKKPNTQYTDRTVNLFCEVVTVISNLPKEIFELTTNEINLLFFNGEYTREHKRTLHFLVKAVYNYFFEILETKPAFNINKINDDYKHRTTLKYDKEIYEIQEYKSFHNYVSNLNFHKRKAIEDVLKCIKSRSEGVRYDSAWLYVLIHLNNGWRHTDVVYGVPRINLTKTKIKDLNWLQNNDIDEEDMKTILYQVKRKVTRRNHQKNNGERFFFWSEQLAPSLANALAICELRTQILNPNANHLINFETKHQEFSKRVKTYKEFFKSFNSSSIFESLKMNRTLLSYTFSVIKQKNPEEALATSQHLRGHLDKETTNIYVMIPQDEMDFLISQLFERDNFGYIPYILSNILIGEEKRDLKLKTEQIKAIKEEFGDIYKIEFFASFLNDIINERVSVEEILKSTKPHEIEALNFKLLTQQLPAKQEHFQCLVSAHGCQRPEINDCSGCLLSIPNYYALSAITQRLKERILNMLVEFPTLELEADKVRYAKLFNRDMLLLKDAIDKYGKEEVFEVMDISIEDYRLLLSKIPSLKKYLESEHK